MKRLMALGMLVIVCAAGHAQAVTLLARYDFENAASLGQDSTALANNATNVANIVQVAGRHNGTKAAAFNGSSSVIQRIGAMNGDTTNPDFSIAAWVKVAAGHSAYDGIVSQDNGGCCENRLLISPANNLFINVHEHSDRNLTAATVPTDEWFHVVLSGENVGGSGIGRAYINGVEVSQSPQVFSLMQSTVFSQLHLGAGEGGGPHRFQGALDDVRIYEGALSAAQVSALALADLPEPGTAALGLIALAALTRRRRYARS